tara:strand:- start:2454 stop:3110 length:657 start_codon:yes stop_codon:yes gene_type:complete
MQKEAFSIKGLSRVFNPQMMSRAGQIAASDTATLRAFDKAMQATAKGGANNPGSKALKAYSKYYMGPAHVVTKAMYGGKADMAKMFALLGGSAAGVRYGGEAARPFLGSLSSIASKINPEAMKNMSAGGLDSTLNIIKPGMALTSLPAVTLDNALGGILNAGQHPILATLGMLPAAYGLGRGGSAMLSALGRNRRLKLLRKGIAPKAYRSHAQQLGFK